MKCEEKQQKQNKFFKLIQRNNVTDLFKDVTKNTEIIYEHNNYNNYLETKITKKSKKIMLDRLRLFKNLKILSGL